jgi:hypothetical protein
MKGFIASLLVPLCLVVLSGGYCAAVGVGVSSPQVVEEEEIVVNVNVEEPQEEDEGFLMGEIYDLKPSKEELLSKEKAKEDAMTVKKHSHYACQEPSDCQNGYYCSSTTSTSGGHCQKFGDCTLDEDCVNPANEFPGNNDDPYCFSECDLTEGTCLTMCQDEEEEMPPDNYVVPNQDEPEEEEVSLSKSSSSSSSSSSLECANNEACDDGMFCSRGHCQTLGQCDEDIDCQNPSNSYPTTKCRGPVSCQQGACSRTCSSSGCAKGVSEVQCFAQPCRVSACPESVVCVDEYCGGCNAIHFDAAGFQVCGGA